MGLLAWIVRAILFLFVFRLVGLALRAFLGGLARGARPPNQPTGAPSPPRGQVEELVKDPVCGVHTARSSAITGTYRGSPAYFCSDECRMKALAAS